MISNKLKLLRILLPIALAVGISLILVTEVFAAGQPTVTSSAADTITSTSATLYGNVTVVNDTNTVDRGFVWDTATKADPGNVAPASSGYTSNWTESGTWTTGAFNHGITGLTQGQFVYWRACAHNDAGYWAYSAERSFNTTITDVYWVGGSGRWYGDRATHWSNTSGGTPNAIYLPTATVNVHMDANSFSGTGQIVQVDGYISSPPTSSNICKDMDWTGALYSPSLQATGNNFYGIEIYGNVTLISGMSLLNNGNYGFTFYFNGGGASTFNSSGCSVISNAVATYGLSSYGGGLSIQDNLTSPYWSLGVEGGTVSTNNYTLNFIQISHSTGNLSTLNLGSSTINIYASVGLTGANLTFNAGTSTINLLTTAYYWNTGGQYITSSGTARTYYDVSSNALNAYINEANTFHNLSITGTDNADNYFELRGNPTVTGTFTTTGANASHRLLLRAQTLHTQKTISAATIGTCSNTLFRDINATGAGNWNLSASTGIGDCGGNTGITFPTGINVYAVGGSGNYNWSTASKWASTSGGSGGSGRVPLPQDIAVFDASSISVPTVTVTLDVHELSGIITSGGISNGVTVTAVTNNPTFYNNTANVDFYNSLNMAGSTFNYNTWVVYMLGQTAQTLSGTFSGLGSGNGLVIDVKSGSVSLNGNFTITQQTNAIGMSVTSGIFVTNNYAVTVPNFTAAGATTGVNLGSSIVTITSTYNGTLIWNMASAVSFNAGTSTIVFDNITSYAASFTGGGKTYYNFTIQGSGSYTTTFGDANTFNNITIIRNSGTNPAAKTIAGNYTQTIQHLYSPNFGTTQTTITNTDFTKTSGLVYIQYATISGSAAGGGATFLAGSAPPSVNGGSNSGWSFADATAPTISASAATLTTRITAVLNGSLDNLGSYSSDGVYIYFQYDTSGSYTPGFYTETTPVLYTTIGIKSQGIGSLIFNTTYHFRVVCSYNGPNYLYGTDTTFLTLGAPVVLTQNPVGKTGTSATLVGTLSDLGDYADGFASFEYTTDAYYIAHAGAYDSVTAPEQYMDALDVFNKTIGSLTVGGTYHYRAMFRYNATQYAYGADVTFVSTLDNLPVVTTTPATNVGLTFATVNGSIDNFGNALLLFISFDWCTDSYWTATGTFHTYDQLTQEYSFTPTSESKVSYNNLIGLKSGTKYHYRIKARYTTSDYVYGADAYFTTTGTAAGGAGSVTDFANTIQNANMPSSWFGVGGGAVNLPFYGHTGADGWGFSQVAQETGITVQTLYLMMMLATASAIMFGVYLFTGSVLMTLAAGGVTLGMAVSTTVASGWMVFVFLIMGAGIWYLSKT